MTVIEVGTELQRRQAEKLRRELGPVVMQQLHDSRVVEVMVNPDGTLWVDVLGEGLRNFSKTPGSLTTLPRNWRVGG